MTILAIWLNRSSWRRKNCRGNYRDRLNAAMRCRREDKREARNQADDYVNEIRELKERLEQEQRKAFWQGQDLKESASRVEALEEKLKREQDEKHAMMMMMKDMEVMMKMMNEKSSKFEIKGEEEVIKQAEQITKLREKTTEELMKVQKRLDARRANSIKERAMAESKIKDEITRQTRIKSFIREAEEIREAREQEDAREQEAREHDEAREPEEEEEEKRNDWNEDENGIKSDDFMIIEVKKCRTMAKKKEIKVGRKKEATRKPRKVFFGRKPREKWKNWAKMGTMVEGCCDKCIGVGFKKSGKPKVKIKHKSRGGGREFKS